MRGETEQAQKYAQESYDYMIGMSGEPTQWQRNQFYCRSLPLKARGEFGLVRDEIENALALSGQPVKRGSMAHDHDVYMVLADTAVQSQDADAIKRYAPRLEELATRDGHKLYLAIAHRAHGVAHRLAGEHGKAETRLNRAVEIFNELGTQWQIGRTLFALGEMESARSNQANARDHFTRALAAFEALGAKPDIERTRAALKES